MSKVKIFLLLQFLFFFSVPVLAQVDTAWVRRYDGGNGADKSVALAVDKNGNVYVTGTSPGSGTQEDYITIKYNSSGDTVWVRRYNGPTNNRDFATDLTIDNNGNVYVTGESWGGTYWDFATIKYAPNGDTLWARRYNGPGNFFDGAYALAVDDSGNVYVTGFSYGSGPGPDYATIKYAPNGDSLWVRRYTGPSNGGGSAYALAVDDSGNVYVTGVSERDYATIKYAPNGDTLWVRHYNGPGYWLDWAQALSVDGSGNLHVTGYSASSDIFPFNYDYATIKYSPDGNILWVRRYDGTGNLDDYARALVVDDSGNVYVTGGSYGSGTGQDYTTIKYSTAGDTLWVRRYNGSGNSGDHAYSLALDDSGNVYVTGGSVAGGTSDDYVTIKYAPNGDTLWIRRYNGPGNASDIAHALAVDDSGNVYVTGESVAGGTGDDYVTIKYNSFGCAAWAGDANGSGGITLPDIVYLINSIFKAGPKPDPFCSGDANADGKILLSDIVYLINHIFRSGPAPVKSLECCL